MRVFIFLLAFCAAATALAQPNQYAEQFTTIFHKLATGGQWVFTGKPHRFTVTFTAKKMIDKQGPNYIIADDHILQASLVPLPVSSLDLTKLTIAQQKETLEGYVGYEMDYFTTELKIKVKNLVKDWVTINGKLWLVWTFDNTDIPLNEPLESVPVSQIYVSTICFNQVLDLNTPVMKGDKLAALKEYIKKMMGTLELK